MRPVRELNGNLAAGPATSTGLIVSSHYRNVMQLDYVGQAKGTVIIRCVRF